MQPNTVPEAILSLENIDKSFPGTKALSCARLNAYPGRVMGLLGENGAGKSTLMKIITGIYQKDAGEILFKSQAVNFKNVRESQAAGIAMVHQEPHILPDLTIAENILLAREVMKHRWKIDWSKMFDKVDHILSQLNIRKKARDLAQGLSIGDQKIIEIAKALSLDAQVIIMDEPTDALTETEVQQLFTIIKMLCDSGKSIIYISHRMEEIFTICDRITIMRDGHFISEASIGELTGEEIIEKMVGRTVEKTPSTAQEVPRQDQMQEVLRLDKVSNAYINEVSLSLHSHEIVGIFGLMGAGRTELAQSIYGCYPFTKGQMLLSGKGVNINSPYLALQHGIVYVSEDRKVDGLIIDASVRENMSLSALPQLCNALGVIDGKKEKAQVGEYIKKFSIKTPSQSQIVANLSGGNQQKIAIAKALMCQPKVLILGEPTRGVDVGAKREIYRLIQQLKEQGMAILLISSEIPEIIALSDRIVVMKENTATAKLPLEEVSQESILHHAIS